MLKLELKNGNKIVCGKGNEYEHGGYLKLIDAEGKEVLYYDVEEWKENPEQIISAFMNCAFKLENERKVTPCQK